MASNIYGYQGVHTPLESVTQGKYTLADYTSMRTELTTRLIALENQGGFVPTNVEMTGYLNMVPGSGGQGQIYTPSSITCNSASIGIGGGVVEGNLTVGGLISGNGSLLTGVTGTDSTKLPLTGGTLTGPLISSSILSNGNITVNGGYMFSGNGSGLTNIDDITKLPKSGGTMTGDLTMSAGYKYYGDGSGLTGIAASDPTKLPLAGGTLTGDLNAQNITLQGNSVIKGDGSALSVIGRNTYDQLLNQIIIPDANYYKHYHIILNYQNSCTVRFSNLYPLLQYLPDGGRYITVTKKGLATGAFTVTLSLPVQAGYNWYWSTPEVDLGTGSITMGASIFSYTFYVQTNGVGQGVCYLVNKVTT